MKTIICKVTEEHGFVQVTKDNNERYHLIYNGNDQEFENITDIMVIYTFMR